MRGMPTLQALDHNFRIENNDTHGRHATLTQHDYNNAAEKRPNTRAGSGGYRLTYARCQTGYNLGGLGAKTGKQTGA